MRRNAGLNPLQDITELQRVKFVMKGGRVLKNQIPAAGMSTSRQQ